MTGFNHIYVEHAVRDHPRTGELLDRLRPRRVTGITDAQKFFNRPGQDFTRQQTDRKLILAQKNETFLYAATGRIMSFGDERTVYYNDVLRNCLYDCDYCFLQGMHRSANILYHVNLEDYLTEVDRRIAAARAEQPPGVTAAGTLPLYLSVSYLTDLLGFERSLGLARFWIEATRDRTGLEVEIRTKSDGFNTLLDCVPAPGVILTWSLSPEQVAREQESGTAAFRQRVLDARRAIDAGWRVRICFDPVIARPGWEALYQDAVDETFRRLDPDHIEAVSFGVFRMHPGYFRHLPPARRTTSISGGATLSVDSYGARSYESRLRDEIFRELRRHLERHLPPEKIHRVHG